jgi:hypothetical protein
LKPLFTNNGTYPLWSRCAWVRMIASMCEAGTG